MMSQSFYEQKQRLLAAQHSQLSEEYKAIQAQISRALSEVEVIRLRRQAEHTEQALLRNEEEQVEVSRLLEDAAATTNTTQRSNLVEFMARHFNDEEIKDVCFRMQIEYNDLAAEGRSGKIRELVLFVERHGRVQELHKLVRKLRPRLPWNDTLTEEAGE